MAKWTRQKQEIAGSYFFNGKMLATARVASELTQEEIQHIVKDLLDFVTENQGADYLQVYVSDDGRRVWIMDQLDKEMIESGDYKPDNNYFTILFPDEY